jgi:tetratricopeptide (TPR) repeat protein
LLQFLSPNDLSFSKLSNNIGSTYQDMGKYEESFKCYQRNIDILKSNFGTSHPYYATALNNMADLYLEMEDYEKSLALLQQAIKIFEHFYEQTPEINNSDTANSYDGLALTYIKMGNFHSAIQPSKEALKIYKKAFGKNHIKVAMALKNLARVYLIVGEYIDALILCENALEIFEKNQSYESDFLETMDDFIMIIQKMTEKDLNQIYSRPSLQG